MHKQNLSTSDKSTKTKVEMMLLASYLTQPSVKLVRARSPYHSLAQSNQNIMIFDKLNFKDYKAAVATVK